MQKRINVLIIDDHPLIAEAYKSALLHITQINEGISFEIALVETCEDADQKILEATTKNNIDIVFLDINLPPAEKLKIFSGEDLGIKIREELPEAKIIISTTHNDNYRIHNIFKSVNPEGFLIKNDITPQELVQSINTVIDSPPYYSRTVLKLLRMHIANDFVLDKFDRQLLYELSIGTKTKDLPNILPLSIAGIEKRKRSLRQLFDITEKGDGQLIKVAKEKGFI